MELKLSVLDFSNTEGQGLDFFMMVDDWCGIGGQLPWEDQFLCTFVACCLSGLSFPICFCLICSGWLDHLDKNRFGDWLDWQEENRVDLLGWATLGNVKTRGWDYAGS